MNKSQLKQLIKEVLREVESEESKTSTSGSDFTKHTSDVQKKGDEAIIKMTVRGVKPGGAFKKFLSKLAADAIAADWAVLKADMEKSGVKVASMNHEDLTNVATQAGKPELAPQASEDEFDIKNVNPAVWKGMSPEKRAKYIKPGSHAEEWKAATEKDSQAEKEKLRLRTAAMKAGTLDWDEESNRPEDTKYWTDKDWDYYNQGLPTPSSGEKYKPTLKKDTARGVKGAVRAGFSDTLRHE